MSDGTPFTIRSSLSCRQAGLLALGSAGGSQPSHRFLITGSGGHQAFTASVPDYSGGTAPDSHRVPDCLGSFSLGLIYRPAPGLSRGNWRGGVSGGHAHLTWLFALAPRNQNNNATYNIHKAKNSLPLRGGRVGVGVASLEKVRVHKSPPPPTPNPLPSKGLSLPTSFIAGGTAFPGCDENLRRLESLRHRRLICCQSGIER